MDARLHAVIADILDLDPAAIEVDMRREDTDSWDSMTHLRLITAVESTFDVHLTMEEIAAVESPRQLEDLLRRYGGLRD